MGALRTTGMSTLDRVSSACSRICHGTGDTTHTDGPEALSAGKEKNCVTQIPQHERATADRRQTRSWTHSHTAEPCPDPHGSPGEPPRGTGRHISTAHARYPVTRLRLSWWGPRKATPRHRLMDSEGGKFCGLFRGVGVPTCRPRGVHLEVEPARSRGPAHAPQDHRPLAPGAVPVPRASRASPVVALSEVLVGSWPARFRFRLTPQGAVPSSPATRAQSGPRRLAASCRCPCLIAPFALRLGFFFSEPPAVGPLPPYTRVCRRFARFHGFTAFNCREMY